MSVRDYSAPMKAVEQLWEVFVARREGVLVPRWQLWQAGKTGAFYLDEVRDTELFRTVRRARLVDPGGDALLPLLFDATVISAKPDLWTLTGFERVTGEGGQTRAFAQSWLMSPVVKP